MTGPADLQGRTARHAPGGRVARQERSGVDGQLSPTPQLPEPAGKQRYWFTIRTLLRTRIVAGLLTVLPIWLTYVLARFIFDPAFNVMKSTTVPVATRLTELLRKSPSPFISWVLKYYEAWIVPTVAILLTLFLLYCLGLISANVFGRRIIASIESVFERLPMIKTVYRSIKQITVAIGDFQSMHFQRVVLIDFPSRGLKRIAFLTSVMTDANTHRPIATVFVPYTPYLVTGFMQLVPLEEVWETNWTVEQAVKWVMSGGIIHPSTLTFDQQRPIRWEEDARAETSGAAPLRSSKG
jgi:uncharacterized membrane protein